MSNSGDADDSCAVHVFTVEFGSVTGADAVAELA
jgi:hypothetical protein